MTQPVNSDARIMTFGPDGPVVGEHRSEPMRAVSSANNTQTQYTCPAIQHSTVSQSSCGTYSATRRSARRRPHLRRNGSGTALTLLLRPYGLEGESWARTVR